MRYNKEKTKESNEYCYFTCELCGLPSRVPKKTVDPKNPVWHLSSSYLKRSRSTQSSSRIQPSRGAARVSDNPPEKRKRNARSSSKVPAARPSSKAPEPEQPAPHIMSDRARLAEEVLIMFEDIHTLGRRRNELVKIEEERKVALEEAYELVKKRKQECVITRGEIIEVDKREKELIESAPNLVRALAAHK